MRTTDVTAYPAVQEVAELFDVTVLADICDPNDGEHTAPCPKVDGDGHGVSEEYFECTCPPVQVYAIGWHQELSAGIRGGSMSPYFRTMEELDAFCAKHIDRFRKEAEGDSIPDSESWPV